MHVMRDVVAPLYARLLATASARLEAHTRRSADPPADTATAAAVMAQSPSRYSIFSLLPCPTPLEPWRALAHALLPLLADQRVLFSNLNGGCHLSLSQALLLEACGTTAEILALPPAPPAAPPLGAAGAAAGTKAGSGAGETNCGRLERLLLTEGLPVALVPKDVLATLADLDTAAIAAMTLWQAAVGDWER
jgi:hypothetical protein